MDIKILLACIMTAFFLFNLIHESVKEKRRHKKEKDEKDLQTAFYKTISNQLIDNSLINKEILKYLKFSTQKYVDEITESQARIVIDSVLSNSQFELFNFIKKIISENHIKGNEKEVTAKLKLFISNRFHKDSLLLKEFKYNEKNIGGLSNVSWKEYLTENILDNVLREKGEKAIYSALQNAYDSFKYDMLDKVLS